MTTTRNRESTTKRTGALALIGTALLGLTAGAAWAGAPTDQLRKGVDAVVAILKDPALKGPARAEARLAAIRRVADRAFDFPEMARRALGRHWRTRTEAEQREFTGLFGELLQRTYASLIEERGGYHGEKVLYVGETVDGEYATVRTLLVTRRSTEVPIDYSMLKHGDRWLVYDVSVENVSLVQNYRSQFNTILSSASYDALIKRIEAKLEEFRRKAGTQAQGG